MRTWMVMLWGLLAVPGPADAQVGGFGERIGNGVESAVMSLEQALFPQAPPGADHAPLDGASSCAALYAETGRLLDRGYHQVPKFTENPINGIIGAAGTLFPPAWLLWALPANARYQEGRRLDADEARVAELREMMAARACWVR